MADARTRSYILKHAAIPVADIELEYGTGAISAIGPVYNERHVPVGIPVKKGRIDRAALNAWWRGRAIPDSRDGIKETMLNLKLSSTRRLLDRSFGLSLSDSYWICPSHEEADWSNLNFFENLFSEAWGNVLLGTGEASENMSFMSPDNTLDGWLKKKWSIRNGKRCLIKKGSGTLQQEPYNEVLASRLMERLGVPHVSYALLMQDGQPYSVCDNFITPQTELVTAFYVMQTQHKPNHVSLYRHYLNCCEALGIPGMIAALDRMIVVDYLIANEDRHLNNFGVIRHAETLEWIGAAPIYDSGSSLWFTKPLDSISPTAKLICKPFKQEHQEQLKLVTSFDWLDLSALRGLDEELRDILRASPVIHEARREALCVALQGRIDMLDRFIRTRSSRICADDRSADVKENVAYSGLAAGEDKAQN